MKTSAFLLIGAVALTAGCEAAVPPLPITTEPVGIGVRVGVPAERLRATTRMTVRTYDARAEGRVEVAGMTCDLTSNEMQGSVVTPGIVIVPSFDQDRNLENRGRPDQVLVSCDGNGLTGNTTVVANDKEITTATNAGLVGAILTTAVTAAVASSTPWKLPETVGVGVR